MGDFLPLLQLKESKETPLGKEQISQAEKSHHKGGERPDGLSGTQSEDGVLGGERRTKALAV